MTDPKPDRYTSLTVDGDRASPRLAILYLGTNACARDRGPGVSALIATLVDAGCCVVTAAPTTEGPEGRQWTESDALGALDAAWNIVYGAPAVWCFGVSNGTRAASLAAPRLPSLRGVGLFIGTGILRLIPDGTPLHVAAGSRDKLAPLTAERRAEVEARGGVVTLYPHRHSVDARHFGAMLRTLGLVTP